jgi:spore coat polysaccharide biosynthesis predicted glycosyltransferase SpsG
MESALKVGFRVDSSPEVGIGHEIRCKALEAFLIQRGHQTYWASRNAHLCSGQEDLLLKGEASFSRLGLDEAKAVHRFCESFDWLILDHYGADEDYLRACCDQLHCKTLVLDDHFHRKAADLRLAPLGLDQAQSLNGLEYVLFRKPFLDAQNQAGQTRQGGLISFGGSDQEGQTRSAIELVLRSTVKDNFVVLASEKMMTDQQLQDFEKLERVEIISWANAQHMAKLFSQSAWSLVSCTNTAFESLCMGCPTIAIEWVDNQRQHAHALKSHGIKVVNSIEQLNQNWKDDLRHVSLFDGRGAERVVMELESQQSLSI